MSVTWHFWESLFVITSMSKDNSPHPSKQMKYLDIRNMYYSYLFKKHLDIFYWMLTIEFVCNFFYWIWRLSNMTITKNIKYKSNFFWRYIKEVVSWFPFYSVGSILIDIWFYDMYFKIYKNKTIFNKKNLIFISN